MSGGAHDATTWVSGGLHLAIRGGRLVLGPGVRAESRSTKRLAALRQVARSELAGEHGGRIQYWTFSGVGDQEHYDQLSALPVSYDLTFLPDRPVGSERPKTHGHSHVRQDSAPGGYPEVYQVLLGQAGFMFQDLRPGPAATFAVLVTAGAGERVVIPPLVQHCTINMADSALVVANLVYRSAGHDYFSLPAARGMAHYATLTQGIVANPAYLAKPELAVYTAAEWSAASDGLLVPRGSPLPAGSLYTMLVEQPVLFDWLCDPTDNLLVPRTG